MKYKEIYEVKHVWDPNNFLSKQFMVHAEIYESPLRNKYIELSSGVNNLPTPSIWKETIKKEIEEEFLYKQYTLLDGFQTTKYAVKLYENYLYSQGELFLKEDIDVCMTIGASQAAALALDYFKSIGKKKMLLIGMTYPLYATLGEQYNYQVNEVRSSRRDKDMPTAEEIIEAIKCFNSDVLIFSYPCNPSGERIEDKELNKIMQTLHEKNIFCIFDCTCNVIMSRKKVEFPEKNILNNKMTDKCVIVNSFSKTESVPGFRIGYIVGDSNLIQFVRGKQVIIMNPPNTPTISVWITMMFRCLYLSEQYGKSNEEKIKIVKAFKRIFLFTTVLCSERIRNYVKELVDCRIWEEYLKFKEEMLSQEKIFEKNKIYFIKKMSGFIASETRMDTGFNFMIKLRNVHGYNEMELCQKLLKEKNIAIFTESGFALQKAKDDNYWIRISLALPCDIFRDATDRLYDFLAKYDKEI